MELVRCEKTDSDCKGRVYRYRESNYISASGEIVIKQSFRLLKRLSCPGCEKCGWMMETLSEDMSCGCLPEIKGHPQADGIYQLVFKAGAPDWETGVVEDWEWYFVKCIPQEGESE